MKKGTLFILSGPSGSGKSTLVKKLFKKPLPGLVESVSCTTRSPRKGEKHGKDYSFVSVEKFKKGIKRNEFLEHQKVFNNYYGTPRQYVERQLRQGKDVLLCIDVKGALFIKKQLGSRAVYIFVLPPSVQELKKRLKTHHESKKEEYKKRLGASKVEIEKAQRNYDYFIVNDKLVDAGKKLRSIIIAERCRRNYVFNNSSGRTVKSRRGKRL